MSISSDDYFLTTTTTIIIVMIICEIINKTHYSSKYSGLTFSPEQKDMMMSKPFAASHSVEDKK